MARNRPARLHRRAALVLEGALTLTRHRQAVEGQDALEKRLDAEQQEAGFSIQRLREPPPERSRMCFRIASSVIHRIGIVDRPPGASA